ncbi:MAG: hypothetical protein FWF24_05715 [Alphaproteobacteria bacterium]|nr:hypothetical protein [Alphaproteobacteria bacterium]
MSAWKTLFLSFFCCFLASCAGTGGPYPDSLDFKDLGRIYLNVGDLRIVTGSTSPNWAPFIGQSFKPTLVEAVQQWADDRIQTTGTMGHATLTIKDASVTEQPLAIESSWTDLFTRQQVTKYIGRVEVSLTAQRPWDGKMGMASAYAIYEITLPEKADAAERKEAYRKLLISLMHDLDREMEKAIHKHMTLFIDNNVAPNPSAAPRAAVVPVPYYAPPVIID